MSAATTLELDPNNPPRLDAPEAESAEGFGAFTTKLVNDSFTDTEEATFTIRVPKEGVVASVPFDKLFSSKGSPVVLTGLSLQGNGKIGQTLSVKSDTGDGLFPERIALSGSEMYETRAIDLGSVLPTQSTTVYESTLGNYAGITTDVITEGVELVKTTDENGGVVTMASIPLPPLSGSFFVHALEVGHNNKPPIVPPGTLEQNRNPLQPQSHFLIPVDHYKEVIKAYSAASLRDGGGFLSSAMHLDFSPSPDGTDANFIVTAKVQRQPTEVKFQMEAVGLDQPEFAEEEI